MEDSLYELLSPHFPSGTQSGSREDHHGGHNATTMQYLRRLSTLSVPALTTTEPQSLEQSAQSTLISLQSLSNRSHKAFITSADNLSALRSSLPRLNREARTLRDAIPRLDEEAVRFSSKYSKATENNPSLDRRKKAMQLARNVDRLSDILELPSLLSTAVFSAAAAANNSSSGGSSLSSSSTTYSSALDLYAHIKRLQTLYPNSPLVKDVAAQAEDAMKDMTTNLISGLRVHNLRLAAAMRTVGWLRRVAPDLEAPLHHGGGGGGGGALGKGEGALGALFLLCRLAHLVSMLEALDPLRELADQETRKRLGSNNNNNIIGAENGQQRGSSPSSSSSSLAASSSSSSEGHQTEKFLKRYIEVYREQSFAIISLHKSIFSADASELEIGGGGVSSLRTTQPQLPQQHLPNTDNNKEADPLQCLPPALATFPMHLVQLLTETLQTYLPNVQDKSSRESLLTQVLYCAASLGRLGGDFGLILTELSDGAEDGEEWEEVMKKHRALAGRLEQLTVGGGTSNSTNASSRSKSPLLREVSPDHR